MALRHNIAEGGDRIIIMAGVPFGTPGSTNVIHIVRLIGDELTKYRSLKEATAETS
jgi:pyruvate kinase